MHHKHKHKPWYRSTPVKIIGGAITAISLYELSQVYIFREIRRTRLYNEAVARSKEIGKPLLVLGDPDNDNYTLAGHGPGDICVDITGCPNYPQGIKARVEDFVPKQKDNAYVIYGSCILEYIKNLEPLITELKRVSGGDIFYCRMETQTLKTRFFPNLFYRFPRYWMIKQAPPSGEFIIKAIR